MQRNRGTWHKKMWRWIPTGRKSGMEGWGEDNKRKKRGKKEGPEVKEPWGHVSICLPVQVCVVPVLIDEALTTAFRNWCSVCAHAASENKHTNSPSIERTLTLTTSTRAATCKQLTQTCQNSLIRTWDVFKAKADRHEWTCAKCHLGNAALHTFVLFTSTSTYKQTINRETNYWTLSRGEEREERSELTEGQKEHRACYEQRKKEKEGE